MVINMLQNMNHKYYSHNNTIKRVDLTIKCIGFDPIHYAINLDVFSSFIVFNDFDFIFLSIYC